MRVFLYLLCVSFLFSCADKHEDYYDNVTLFQEFVLEVNNYFYNSNLKDINISKYYTDDFVFHSYSAGNKKGYETLKEDYIKNLEGMKLKGISLNIGHSIYLPGIDQETFDLNGSVRVYYGATMCHLDSVGVDFSGYQTIDFLDGKISEMWEWADYGGVANKIMAQTYSE